MSRGPSSSLTKYPSLSRKNDPGLRKKTSEVSCFSTNMPFPSMAMLYGLPVVQTGCWYKLNLLSATVPTSESADIWRFLLSWRSVSSSVPDETGFSFEQLRSKIRTEIESRDLNIQRSFVNRFNSLIYNKYAK